VVEEEKEVAPSISNDEIRALSNKVEELTALIGLLRELIEKETDAPIVEGWFEME